GALLFLGGVEDDLDRVGAGRAARPADGDRVGAAGGGGDRLDQGLLAGGRGGGAADDGAGRGAERYGRLQPRRVGGDQHGDRLAGIDGQRETVGVARRADQARDAWVVDQRAERVLGGQRRGVGYRADVRRVAGREGRPRVAEGVGDGPG